MILFDYIIKHISIYIKSIILLYYTYIGKYYRNIAYIVHFINYNIRTFTSTYLQVKF